MEAPDSQKVVIVNGSVEIFDLLVPGLGGGCYDTVFVQPCETAYSEIKRVQPNLVIICIDNDKMIGFHLLSMLKLDEATREISTITYAYEVPEEEEEEKVSETEQTLPDFDAEATRYFRNHN